MKKIKNGEVCGFESSQWGNGEPWYLILQDTTYRKGDSLTFDGKSQIKVLKCYKRTRWRLFLQWIGFNVKLSEVGVYYKVKSV